MAVTVFIGPDSSRKPLFHARGGQFQHRRFTGGLIMNLHYQPAGTATREIPLVNATIEVLSGGLWITRLGDNEDYLLGPGDTLLLHGGDDVALESTEHGVTTVWRWQPDALDDGESRDALDDRAPDHARRARRGGLFAALARSAASIARLAHGSIRSGDSIASGGAVQ